jgi:thiaminase (transcriptional activator TenA)
LELQFMTDSFAAELWRGITGIYTAILEHPFVTGLADGSLPRESFEYYVVQDALYLRKYARALAAVGSRATVTGETEMFARHASGIVAVEMGLHESLLADLGIDPREADAAEEAPTTLAYTSYLLAACAGSYAEGVGAVLPCYWIYWEVGKHLLEQGSPDPRYQRWIDTYAGEEFGEEAREVIAVIDRVGREIAPVERERVERHFVATSRYEWMFWDMGYRRETWPV